MDHESLTYEQIAGELERLYQLDTRVMPDLRRQIEHHRDGKARWRDRAKEAEAKLAALEAAGVDNWEGYDEAMQSLEDGA